VTKKEKETFPQNQAPKRPALLECDIHYSQIQGEKWIILVGLLEDKPYEIFGGKASLIEIPKKYTTGKISKRQFKTQNGKYDLHIGDEGLVIKDVVSVFNNPNNLAFARMISLGLRHGAKVKFMVEQLLKDRNSDMFSFSKCIARILKGYIENGEVPSDKRCDDCGNDSLIYQDGCVSCTDCGYGKCS
jgi:ribonucleoside-diphosphate reductase alpha chain